MMTLGWQAQAAPKSAAAEPVEEPLRKAVQLATMPISEAVALLQGEQAEDTDTPDAGV